MLENIYKNKKVLVTGHTGFKGSWLAIWLKELGAEVIGYALDPPSEPNNFEATRLREKITHIHGDIRDSMYEICTQQIAEYAKRTKKRNLNGADKRATQS